MQELRAANETLRSLQSQLELVPSPSSSTIHLLLDTKDARIATLERQLGLLENEVKRLGGGSPPPLLVPPPSLLVESVTHAVPVKRQVSFLLNNVHVGTGRSLSSVSDSCCN